MNHDPRESRIPAENAGEEEKLRGGRGQEGARGALPPVCALEVLDRRPSQRLRRARRAKAHLRRSGIPGKRMAIKEAKEFISIS